MLENNQYAYSTPLDQQFAVDPVERAAAYGFPGVKVDGNDAEAMFEATRQARERALAGEGPTLIEAVTMRMHGHAAHDDMKYVPKEQIEEWRAKDPIDRQVRAARGARRRRRGRPRRGQGARSTPPSRRRWRCRCPTRDTATDRAVRRRAALLEDGDGALVAASRRRLSRCRP